MNENDLFKAVAKEKMPDFDEIKKEIVRNGTNRKENNRKIMLAVAALAFVASLTVFFFSRMNRPEAVDSKTEIYKAESGSETGIAEKQCETEIAMESTEAPGKNDVININNGKSMGYIDIDAVIKSVDNGASFEGILLRESDLRYQNYGEVYVRPEIEIMPEGGYTEDDYNVLSFCFAEFGKDDHEKRITLSFSSKSKPLKDFVIEGDRVSSVLSDTNTVIMRYGKNYQADFSLKCGEKTLYFDITSDNVSENEFISFVRNVLTTAYNDTVFLCLLGENEYPGQTGESGPGSLVTGTTQAYTDGISVGVSQGYEPPYNPDEAVSNGYVPNDAGIKSGSENGEILFAPAYNPSVTAE